MAEERSARIRSRLISIGLIVAVIALLLITVLEIVKPWQVPIPGSTLKRNSPATGFTLTDQNGKPFSLKDARGKPVILAFLGTQSTGADQYIALKLSRVVFNLQEHIADVVFAAITTEPAHDTQDVRLDYSRKVGMEDHWRFLSGDSSTLRKLYRSYDVGISAATPIPGSRPNSSGPTGSAGGGAGASVSVTAGNPGADSAAVAPADGMSAESKLLAMLIQRLYGPAPDSTPYPIVWLIDARGRIAGLLPVDGTPVEMTTKIMSLLSNG